MMANADTLLSRNDKILYAAVGADDAVMMSMEAGRYYGLNAVARRVWELLETPKSIAGLREAICTEFDVDAQTCEADLDEFVSQLLAKDVVRALEP